MNIIIPIYPKTNSTWKLRLFNKLKIDEDIFKRQKKKDEDIIVLHAITPINYNDIDFTQIEIDLRKRANTILLSLPEDYDFRMADFYVNDILLGQNLMHGDYLEAMHPATYCGNVPEKVIKMEKKAKSLGNKLFYSLDDCANYLNELISNG